MDSERPEPNPAAGAGRPAGPASAAASAGNRTTAASPKPAHAIARIPMPIRIDRGDSRACSAAGERGIARNVIPNALTNPAAASPRSGREPRRPGSGVGPPGATGLPIPGSSDWKRSHSLTKPFSGGSPAMAREPIKKKAAVQGIPRIRPPSRFMSRVRVAWSTRSGAEEQQPLECGVVQGVVESRREGEEGRGG